MTREEFGAQFARLCEGHRYTATEKQTEAFYEILQGMNPDDLRVAVTRLLAAKAFPSGVGDIEREIVRARESRRRADALERQTAAEAARGPVSILSEQMEQIYSDRRMAMLLEAAKTIGGGVARPAFWVTALAELINDARLTEWMERAPMGVCAVHDRDHSVFQCVVDEWAYWIERAAGHDPVEAYRRMAPRAKVPIRESLLLRTDLYGRVKADQMGVLEFDGDRGPVDHAEGEAKADVPSQGGDALSTTQDGARPIAGA